MAKSKNGQVDPLLAELTAIKRLMAYSLLRDGASQKEVGAAMGISQSQVSRMLPGVGKVT